MDNDRVVYAIRKNPKEEVRFTFREYQDRMYLDVRLWFQPGKGGEYHPTTKGIRLSLEFIPELRKALERVGQEASELAGHSNLSSVK